MRSSTRQAIACIFAFFSVALVAHAQTTPVKEPGATITGKVTVKGKGAPGVFVTILSSNDTYRSGRQYSGPKGITDDEGNYRITNVVPASYRVVAVAKTYVPAEETDREKLVIVSKSETIEHIDFALVRGGVITGKVVDAEGRPVVEEWVSVFTVPDNNFVNQPVNSNTDDRGVYRIYGLRAGTYRVAAGRGEDSFSGGQPRPYRRTYYPSVSDPSEASVVEVTEGGETKDVDITFTRMVSTYTASGRVIDVETGQPLANIEYGITRYQERGTSSMGGGRATNSRGEFKLENLSPGKYGVDISLPEASEMRVEDLRFEIIDQDITGLVVKAAKGGSISGVVVFDGLDDKTARERFNSSWIGAWMEGSVRPSRTPSAKIAEDGSFRLGGLSDGTAILNLYSSVAGNVRINRVERDGAIQPGGIVLKEREHIRGIRVVAAVGNASLRGKIEVANGTLPPDGRYYVWAVRTDDPQGRFSGSNLRPQVDERGQFVIEGLTTGTYEIEAGVFLTSAKLSYRTKRQPVVVTDGTTTNVNITVDLSSTPIKNP